MVKLTENSFFIAPLLKIQFSVPSEQLETAISNPRVETSKVGLKIADSTRSTVTSNQILKRVAIQTNMHYSKQNTTDSTSFLSLVMQYVIKIVTFGQFFMGIQ